MHALLLVTTPWRLQMTRALRRHVGPAVRPLAAPWPSLGWHRQEVHGHVEALHNGDVEEILIVHIVEPKLHDRVWWLTIAFAASKPP